MVDGGRGGDDISGGVGADFLDGGRGPDDIYGGPSTTAVSEPRPSFSCNLFDASTERFQILLGAGGNRADEDDRVAANCETVGRQPSLQATGATPEAEVTITAPEARG